MTRKRNMVVKRGLILGLTLLVGLWSSMAWSGGAEETPEISRPMPMAPQMVAPQPMGYTGFEYVLPHPGTSWHAGYYHPAWGLPVAVVVPPTARYVAQYSWGVGGKHSVPICHQFSRNYPGPGQILRQRLTASPRWPTHTDQLGVYPIRGPW